MHLWQEGVQLTQGAEGRTEQVGEQSEGKQVVCRSQRLGRLRAVKVMIRMS